MYGFIYITTNNVNGKRYLGQCKYGKQCTPTYLGSGKALKRAIKKYGIDQFSRQIIMECLTKQELIENEILLIQQFQCVESDEWYNIAPGGYTTRGFLGRRHKQESNELRASKLRGRTRPPHVGEAVRAASKHRKYHKGTHHHQSRSVTVDGVFYTTVTSAMEATGMSRYSLNKLANTFNRLQS